MELQRFLDRFYRLPKHRNVYVVGCFAKRLTLYSQQVRALNLVYALRQAGEMPEESKVAVIGAGAAGLTAAVAAASLKAKVTLLEKLQGPMDLQQNNRQRWIHPFLYDWPYLSEFVNDAEVTVPPFKGDEAKLPLLSWSADYAANVAQEIVSQWEYYRRQFGIEVRWNVDKKILDLRADGTVSLRPGEDGSEQNFNAIILAVGFGLEAKREDSDSYWSEDNLDSTIRAVGARQRWLVSGAGNGAFIDLMRLCFRRFRQDEVLNFFTSAEGIDGILNPLRDLYEENYSNEEYSENFKSLPIGTKFIDAVRDKLLRRAQHLPEVFLVTPTRHFYSAQTSFLNNLGVLVLERIGSFKHIVGKTRKVERADLKTAKTPATTAEELAGSHFKVQIDVDGANPSPFTIPEYFDRVLIRHGTESVLKNDPDLSDVWEYCQPLKKRWDRLSIKEKPDDTREPQWPEEFFGSRRTILPPSDKDATIENVTGAFVDEAKRFGAWARTLSIYKAVRSDGSSSVTYAVEGLTVEEGALDGVYFLYDSAAGGIDRVVCKSTVRDRGVKWERSNESSSSTTPKSAMDAMEHAQSRVLSGVVWFDPPLDRGDKVSFTLSFRLVNGDAISAWEFRQMYPLSKRVHMDDKVTDGPIEYLARTVWFPVKKLKVRITLPTKIESQPLPGIFMFPEVSEIKKEDIINERDYGKRRVLQYYPAPGSALRGRAMNAFHRPVRPPIEKTFFRNVSPQSWELTATMPAVGSCYSIEWNLDEDSVEARRAGEHTKGESNVLREVEAIFGEAQQFREALLESRLVLLGKGKADMPDMQKLVRDFLLDLHQSMVPELAVSAGDLSVGLMVFQESEEGPDGKAGRLFVVDGVKNGEGIDPRLREFYLPFGMGVGGSAFKGGEAFSFWEDEKDKLQSAIKSLYIPIPGEKQPRFLLDVPIDTPSFIAIQKQSPRDKFDEEVYRRSAQEPSRKSIGIIDVTCAEESPRKSLDELTAVAEAIRGRWEKFGTVELAHLVLSDD
jgi:hypothetical protein